MNEVNKEVQEVKDEVKDKVQEVKELQSDPKTYAHFFKSLRDTEYKDYNSIKKAVIELGLLEANPILYKGLPVTVYSGLIPILSDKEIFVKIVVLEQADSKIAILLPEDLLRVYSKGKDEIDMEYLNQINKSFDLYVENYGFDSTDGKFKDFVIGVYLKSENEAPAYTMSKEKEAKEEKKKKEEVQGSFGGQDSFGGPSLGSRGPMEGRESEQGSMEIGSDYIEPIPGGELPEEELSMNESAYKKFKKESIILENFVRKLGALNKLNKHIKYRFLNENRNVLIIRVDNDILYSLFESKGRARRTMTKLGETIMNSKGTQVVDTFIKDNKRFFILTEAENNYWCVRGEEREVASNPDVYYIKPEPKDIILLERSEVRNDARVHKVFKESTKSNNVIFLKG